MEKSPRAGRCPPAGRTRPGKSRPVVRSDRRSHGTTPRSSSQSWRSARRKSVVIRGRSTARTTSRGVRASSQGGSDTGERARLRSFVRHNFVSPTPREADRRSSIARATIRARWLTAAAKAARRRSRERLVAAHRDDLPPARRTALKRIVRSRAEHLQVCRVADRDPSTRSGSARAIRRCPAQKLLRSGREGGVHPITGLAMRGAVETARLAVRIPRRSVRSNRPRRQ